MSTVRLKAAKHTTAGTWQETLEELDNDPSFVNALARALQACLKMSARPARVIQGAELTAGTRFGGRLWRGCDVTTFDLFIYHCQGS
jgi:hypothetical protein